MGNSGAPYIVMSFLMSSVVGIVIVYSSAAFLSASVLCPPRERSLWGVSIVYLLLF